MRHSVIARRGNRRCAQITAGAILKDYSGTSSCSRRPVFHLGSPSHSSEAEQKVCPKLRASFRRPAYVSYRRFALYSRLAMGCRPFEPRFRKTELNEERNTRPLNGGSHPRSSGRARPVQAERWTPRHECFGLRPADLSGLRLRRTPEEKRRLRELARIGSNLNQIARWANTYQDSLKAVEVIAALTSLETQIENFASGATGETEEDGILADESIPPRHGRWRSPCPLPHP